LPGRNIIPYVNVDILDLHGHHIVSLREWILHWPLSLHPLPRLPVFGGCPGLKTQFTERLANGNISFISKRLSLISTLVAAHRTVAISESVFIHQVVLSAPLRAIVALHIVRERRLVIVLRIKVFFMVGDLLLTLLSVFVVLELRESRLAQWTLVLLLGPLFDAVNVKFMVAGRNLRKLRILYLIKANRTGVLLRLFDHIRTLDVGLYPDPPG
jgi:hypothetical protein